MITNVTMLAVYITYALFTGFQKLEAAVFLKEPQDLYVQEGEDAILHCILSATQTSIRNCYWSKDDKNVMITDRYQFIADTEMDDCSIRLKSVQSATDNGYWKCGTKGTSSTNGAKSRTAKLNVIVVPKDPVILVDGDVVLTGSTVNIDNITNPPQIICLSQYGNPSANLWWLLNKQYIDGIQHQKPLQDTRLMLNSVMDSSWHEKTLFCVANHPSYGFNHQRMAYIHLQVKHNTEKVNARSDIGLRINVEHIGAATEVTLYCTADGFPPPSFYWDIRANYSEPWQLFKVGQNITTSPVSGQFSCSARNDNGMEIRSAEMITISGSKISNREEIYTISFAITGLVFIIAVIIGATLLLIRRKYCRPSQDHQHYRPQHIKTKSQPFPYNRYFLPKKIKHTESYLEKILPNAAYNQSNEPEYLTPNQINSPKRTNTIDNSIIDYSDLDNSATNDFQIYQEILPCENKTYS